MYMYVTAKLYFEDFVAVMTTKMTIKIAQCIASVTDEDMTSTQCIQYMYMYIVHSESYTARSQLYIFISRYHHFGHVTIETTTNLAIALYTIKRRTKPKIKNINEKVWLLYRMLLCSFGKVIYKINK